VVPVSSTTGGREPKRRNFRLAFGGEGIDSMGTAT
jgi:hypothetical protein